MGREIDPAKCWIIDWKMAMAINPLVVFVGMSVATLGTLVAVQQNKYATGPAPTSSQNQTKSVQTPIVLPAPEKLTVTKTATLPVPKKAAVKTQEKPVPKASVSPAKKPSTKTIKPRFDMVRIEPDGGAVIAGRAAPKSNVILKLNGKIIAKSTANETGDWVFVPDQLVPKGTNEIVVESKQKNQPVSRSNQSIIIAMPKSGVAKPLVVVAQQNSPTKVLQKPEITKVVKITPKPIVEKKPKIAPKAIISPRKPQIVAPKKIVQKLAPKAVFKKLPETIAKVAVVKPAPKISKPTKKSAELKLAFGTVDYNDLGDIVFAGKATPGKIVRLYVDNKLVGQSRVDAKGKWTFTGRRKIIPGVHELRADLVTQKGKVARRAVVPFVRAKPRKVADLIQTRKKTARKTIPPAKIITATVAAKPKKVPHPIIVKSPQKTAPTLPAQQPVPPKNVVRSIVPPPPTLPKLPKKIVSNDQPVQPKQQPVTTSIIPDKASELVSHVVIQPGNNLWNISRVIYGSGVAYTTIYQANLTQIKDPNRIYPGQILTTPGTTSSGLIAPDQRQPAQSPPTAN